MSDDPKTMDRGPETEVPESPALAALWETMGSAQAGLDLRRGEVVKDLAELDAQLAHWHTAADQAHDADDQQAYSHANRQLQACAQLRARLMHDLGPDPSRYGVTAEQTLDPETDDGAGVMRTIEPAHDGSDDDGDDGPPAT